jgi:hypothetical protein
MAQTNTIILGWNRAVAGRETAAMELFATTMSFYEKQKASGKLESYEPVFLERHGGDMNGFFILRGTHAQIDALVGNDEFREIVMRADHCLMGLGVIQAYSGPVVGELMQLYGKTIPR